MSNENTSPDTYFVSNVVKRGLLLCGYFQSYTFFVHLVLETAVYCLLYAVALIILKQISKACYRNSESSIYFMDKCPFDLRYLNGGVKTFVKTLRAGENPLVRTIY